MLWRKSSPSRNTKHVSYALGIFCPNPKPWAMRKGCGPDDSGFKLRSMAWMRLWNLLVYPYYCQVSIIAFGQQTCSEPAVYSNWYNYGCTHMLFAITVTLYICACSTVCDLLCCSSRSLITLGKSRHLNMAFCKLVAFGIENATIPSAVPRMCNQRHCAPPAQAAVPYFQDQNPGAGNNPRPPSTWDKSWFDVSVG